MDFITDMAFNMEKRILAIRMADGRVLKMEGAIPATFRIEFPGLDQFIDQGDIRFPWLRTDRIKFETEFLADKMTEYSPEDNVDVRNAVKVETPSIEPARKEINPGEIRGLIERNQSNKGEN